MRRNWVKPYVFMPDFYRLHDHNYTYSYSGSHTYTIAYSDLQVSMSGILNTITLTRWVKTILYILISIKCWQKITSYLINNFCKTHLSHQSPLLGHNWELELVLDPELKHLNHNDQVPDTQKHPCLTHISWKPPI